MTDVIDQLSQIPPAERILLLPHCLRRSNTCRATYDSHGLQCVVCNPECSVNRLRSAAVEYGYKGVCVAPGGRLAINFIKETRPKAIVAIACGKELEEGIQGVSSLAAEDIKPIMVIVPLIKDGCVDTIVDDEKALEIIGKGCAPTGIE